VSWNRRRIAVFSAKAKKRVGGRRRLLIACFLSRGTTAARRRFPAWLFFHEPRETTMNTNGLAMIVGGLVVVVAVFIFFGTDLIRGDRDRDINVTIEAPAAPAN
jgi:hypothetical protein